MNRTGVGSRDSGLGTVQSRYIIYTSVPVHPLQGLSSRPWRTEEVRHALESRRTCNGSTLPICSDVSEWCGFPMSELCAKHGITRPTGYKWLERYRECGPGRAVRSLACVYHCPHRMPEDVAALDAGGSASRHPRWGARKFWRALQAGVCAPPRSFREPQCLRAYSSAKVSGEPAPSLQTPLSARVRRPALAQPKPNQLWTMDFKGQFRTGDHHYCYPLTIMDGATRYLLACQGQLNTCGAWVIPFIDRLFKEHGLPEAGAQRQRLALCEPRTASVGCRVCHCIG